MTDNPQVTETPSSAAATPPAEGATPPTDAPKAEAAKPAEQQLLFGDDKPAEEGKPAEGDKPADAKPEEEVAYKFTLPDGQEIPEENAKEFGDFAKSQKLSQDQAQAALGKFYEYEQAKITQVQETFKQWRTETENDPEIGGQNLDASVNRAKKVLQAFGDDDFKKDLEMFGLGNKTSMLRFLNKVYAKIGEDSVGDAKSGGVPQKLAPEKVLYPEMQ